MRDYPARRGRAHVDDLSIKQEQFDLKDDHLVARKHVPKLERAAPTNAAHRHGVRAQ